MTKEEIIQMANQANLPYDYVGGELMWLDSLEQFAKCVAEKEVEEAHHIIYKSCINQPHWKRSAMRYLKRNAPMLHHQAVNEFNEHPDGRGQE